MKALDRYYSDDITWCVATDCKTDCPRKPIYIRDKTIPHSYTNFSHVCADYEPKGDSDETN